MRSRENYCQIETYRQLSLLVEMYGFTKEHRSIRNAAEFLFSFQAEEGDFRGIYGTQYATTYQGAIMEVLIKAGYADDPRIENGFKWLLSVRQDDGGWAIPVRTAGIKYSDFLGSTDYPDPVLPVRSKPFSHLVTGMALRAYAAHPEYRQSPEAISAGKLLASRLYKKDAYPDRSDIGYWERVSYPFWFTDIISVLDSLSYLGFTGQEPAIASALERLRDRQREDGFFELKLLRDKDKDLPYWICLATCRLFKRYYG